MADIFDNIANATATKSGVWILPGLYRLRVNALKLQTNQKGHQLFIAEFAVLESDVLARPASTEVSWACNLTSHQSAPGNVKAFLAKVLKAAEDEVTPDAVRACVGPDNPLEGQEIRAEASNTKTKAGNDFTVVNWVSL